MMRGAVGGVRYAANNGDCPASTIFAGWRQSVLPVHLLGLAPLLDGGWNRVGQAEDTDAPRRLYYVAMTRAKQTLTLAHLPGTIRSWMHYATFLRSGATHR